jgi:hypothetical protein
MRISLAPDGAGLDLADNYKQIIRYYSYFHSDEAFDDALVDVIFTRKIRCNMRPSGSYWVCTPGVFTHGGRLSSNGQDFFFSKNGSRFWLTKVGEQRRLELDIRQNKPVRQLIQFLLSSEFIKRQMAFLHAAAIVRGHDGIAFPAWGHTGKTSLSLHLVRKGMGFLGDDCIILSASGKMLSFPVAVKLYGYDFRACEFLNSRSKAKPDGLMQFVSATVDKLVPPGQIPVSARLRKVYLLRRSMATTSSVRQLSQSITLNRIRAINFNEFNYLSKLDNLIRLFNLDSDSNTLESQYSEVFRHGLDQAETFELCIPQSSPEVISTIAKDIAESALHNGVERLVLVR